MNQDPAYPSSTTTCRSPRPAAKTLRWPSGGSERRSMQDRGYELPRILILRLSEKGRKSLRCSLMDHRNGTFRPIFASPHRLNPRFEGCSYPFSDSLSRLDFSHLGVKGIDTHSTPLHNKRSHLLPTPCRPW